MTVPAPASGQAVSRAVSQAGRPRPAPRQAPTDLTLAFTDEATVRKRVALLEEPDWLLEERLAALRAFEALPIETNRLYTTYVDLRAAKLAQAEPVLAPRVAVAAGGDDEGLLPEDADGLVEVCSDGPAVLVLSPTARGAGVFLDTLDGLRQRDPDRFRSLIEGGSSLPADDKLAQLTRAFWSQGVVLQVPDGVRLRRPIILRWPSGEPDRALLSRTILAIGEDAQVSVVEEFLPGDPAATVTPAQFGGVAAGESTTSPGQSFFAGTTEVFLGANSTLGVASLQDFPLDEIAFQHRFASVGRGASLRWALAQLGGRLVRSRIDNRLEGDGSSVEQVEIVFGSGDQFFDLTSYTRHLGRDTTSNLLSKGALQDASRTYLKGLITIEKSAVGTDSFLGEFGMLLSRQARSVAVPSLEIDQPDCRRAAHASSVGPIDEGQVFYLESRGIPRDEARKFIVLGFLEPVVARVPLEGTQERLRQLLDAKWTAAHPEPASVA